MSPQPPFGLSLSKPCDGHHQPFDRLRANGPGPARSEDQGMNPQAPFEGMSPQPPFEGMNPQAPFEGLSPQPPFGLSLSKPCANHHQPFDRLRANSPGTDSICDMEH